MGISAGAGGPNSPSVQGGAGRTTYTTSTRWEEIPERLEMSRDHLENKIRIFTTTRDKTNKHAVVGWLGFLTSVVAVATAEESFTVPLIGAQSTTVYWVLSGVSATWLLGLLAASLMHGVRRHGPILSIGSVRLLDRPRDWVPLNIADFVEHLASEIKEQERPQARPESSDRSMSSGPP